MSAPQTIKDREPDHRFVSGPWVVKLYLDRAKDALDYTDATITAEVYLDLDLHEVMQKEDVLIAFEQYNADRAAGKEARIEIQGVMRGSYGTASMPEMVKDAICHDAIDQHIILVESGHNMLVHDGSEPLI